MQVSDIHKIITKSRIFEENGKHNILSQGSINCKAGKWNITDDKYIDFLKNINSAIHHNSAVQMHFMEKPGVTFNILKIDVDLRFTATNEEKRQRENIKRRYNDEFIELLVNCIKDNIEKIINIKESFNIYVQEKKQPKITNDNVIKDGIHIIVPDLILSNQALFYLRERIITDEYINEIVKDIDNISKIDDVIDRKIIYPNAWYIYGCGKPADYGDYYKITKIYKVMKKQDTGKFILKKIGMSDKTVMENILMFSNFGKQPTVANSDYLIKFDTIEMQKRYSNDYVIPKVFGKSDKIAILRMYAQNQTNFHRISALTPTEINALLNCIKKTRANTYDDWRRIGLSLYNMDDRNYEIWNTWSQLSTKYVDGECFSIWYTDFPKCSRYNMGLNKLKDIAKQDNIEEYKKIINISKKNFFNKWIQEHAKETHIKGLSISTLSKNIKEYIKDYAPFNIACACPGATPTWYKFDRHKWTEDKAANKIYMVMTDDLHKELTDIHTELKDKMYKNQEAVIAATQLRNGGNRDGEGEEDGEDTDSSYMNNIRDDRKDTTNVEAEAIKHVKDLHEKLCLQKCGSILEFLATPVNKKKIIEDLSQKCYDEEFYTNLDENKNVFVCTNGVLDLETCRFRSGEPDDMMTISSKVMYPKNVDSMESQTIIHHIQEWLDKIFPDDELQEYVLNIFSTKLSGNLHGEKFHILTGTGANGKSQFFKCMAEVFGKYYKTFDNTLLNTPKRDANQASPAIASLKGCRIAVTTEPKNGQPFESDKVKELISGDPLYGRHLNKDPIEFIPQYMMMLQCNDIPRNESTDDGFWRKIFVVPCESKFVIKEDDLFKLSDPAKYPNHFKGINQEHLYKTWSPYILNMLFERYKALKLKNFEFNVPSKVKIATKIYQDEASTYTQFFNDKIEEAPGCKLDSNTLYAEFQLFVGRDFKPIKTTFLKQMERFIGKPKGKYKDYYGFKMAGTNGDLIEDDDA